MYRNYAFGSFFNSQSKKLKIIIIIIIIINNLFLFLKETEEATTTPSTMNHVSPTASGSSFSKKQDTIAGIGKRS